MKRMIKVLGILSIIGLFGVTSVFAAESDSADNEVDVLVQSGEFSLASPGLSKEFGNVTLKAEIQTLNATLNPLVITDLTGLQEGWRLDVSADVLKNGAGDVLPDGSLTLNRAGTFKRIDKSSQNGAMPKINNTSALAIDEGSPVTVAEAPVLGGMGVFELTLPDDALALTIDPTTARTGGASATYVTTLNWSLVQGP